ncbi:MAG: hypothetical protein ACX939_02530 [Hyphococcus sp.]
MGATTQNDDFEPDYAWRRAAPLARKATMAAFAWQNPGWSFLAAIGLSLPFMAAALLAPAMLSLSPTADMLAPIAEARAIAAGKASLLDSTSPFFMLLLSAADLLTDAPGRIHLIAKSFAALIVVYPFAYFASSRLPTVQAALFTGALAAYVAAPFAGPAEFGLALFLICAFCFVAASADAGAPRARLEGLAAGAALYVLWLLNPVYSLAGFLALSACPFLSGRSGLSRYAATLTAFAALAALAEYAAPGLNLARASAASGVLSAPAAYQGAEGAMGMSGVAISAMVVVASAAVFGGREHWRGWASALGLGLTALIAARLVGAGAMPVFVLVAAIACFSVASPFYDGLFRNHDRASVSVALASAALTLFWTSAIPIHAAGQFMLQHQVAATAPDDIRAELALVQPGGPTIARWVEEGRFSTPEAREFFALAPVDQSMMLLEAASRVRAISAEGVDVAILTGADTACVLAPRQKCHADGPAAASAANVVLVPRLDLDPATAEAKGRVEALLYTEFRLVDQTALWEVWIRRGTSVPTSLAGAATGALYR